MWIAQLLESIVGRIFLSILENFFQSASIFPRKSISAIYNVLQNDPLVARPKSKKSLHHGKI